MRRIMYIVFAFSFILSGCQSIPVKPTDSFSKRTSISFHQWEIPGYFVPKNISVIGLGDSLTEGLGDERDKGGYFGRITTEMNNWKGVKEVQVNNLAKRGQMSNELISQLENQTVQSEIKKADVIFLTIGGNDIMKIVKQNLFHLTSTPFYNELPRFEQRLNELFGMIRGLNGDVVIVISGLYNPLTLVTDEVSVFDGIIEDWNDVIEAQTALDGNSCFVPVIDLFDSNANMVYHTDFFHPNAKGYEAMATRIHEQIKQCGLFKLSDGELDM